MQKAQRIKRVARTRRLNVVNLETLHTMQYVVLASGTHTAATCCLTTFRSFSV